MFYYVACAAGLGAIVVSSLRWLRVAQREHYVAGYTSRFAWRWFSDWQRPANPLLGMVGVAAVLLLLLESGNLVVSVAALAVVILATLYAPKGLGYRGTTSKLKFTRRLSLLAGIVWLLGAVLVAVGGFLGIGPQVAGAILLLLPSLVDLALVLSLPIEERSIASYVNAAKTKLAKTPVRVVGITGSYGKTSTKVYLAHLISGTFSTVASPASFNNRAGLSRTVNETLGPGTEVLVAEMGTFKKGEIAALCEWLSPDISAITSIGPVHLERFGSEEAILEAKSEIIPSAKVVVLNTDDLRLAQLAREVEAAGRHVVSISGQDVEADVAVAEDGDGRFVVFAKQRQIAVVPAMDISRTNLAVAVAIALELGVPETSIADRLPNLPVASSRLNVTVSDSGIIVLDDTYNSNPAGARLALAALVRRSGTAKRAAVVTPGMIELGRRQWEENALFSKEAAMVTSDFVVVGYTNRPALVQGIKDAEAQGKSPNVVLVERRSEAVKWIRENLAPGDVVLYENDLPDHFL